MRNRKNQKINKWNYSDTDTYIDKSPYDYTSENVDQMQFTPDEYVEHSPWRTLGYMEGYGQFISDSEVPQFQVFEGELADELNTEKLNEYGLKALKWYWEGLSGQKPTKNFESFVDAFYYDDELKQNFRSEDLPDLGHQVAIYLLDHPYPDEAKLREGFKDLAGRTPEGQIPTKWGIGQVIVEAAKETSFMDYFKLTKEAVVEAGEEFRSVATKAAIGYSTYKVAAVAVGGLVAVAMILDTITRKTK